MKSVLLVAIGLSVFFTAGYFVSTFTAKKHQVKLELASSSRSPAAIRKEFDYSNIQGDDLDKKFQERLIAGAKASSDSGNIGIDLGNFVISEGSEKIFACKKYSVVVIEFVGDGQAINSELPKMEVQGECVVNNDINYISGPKIPVQELLGTPVAEGDFTFGKVKLKFTNVSDQWPKTWKVVSVRVFNLQNASEQIIVKEKQISELRQNPIIINF
jgi:hypothetical protein